MQTNPRLLVWCVGVVAAALTVAGPVWAEEIQWRFNIDLVETRPQAQLGGRFAERVKEKSGGRLKITPFYGGSLGFTQSDSLRTLKAGSVEMATVYAGYLSRDAPDLAIALVQGVILSPQEMVKLIPTLQDIYRQAYGRWGVTVTGWLMDSVYEISVFCKEPVDSLAKLRGKKVRVWSKDQIDAFAKLGVAAQIVPQNDLYLALQTGVVDCALYVAGVARTISLQEVTKYASRLHTYSALPSAIGVSTRHWDKLPKDLQGIVSEAGEWAWKESEKRLLDFSDEEKARKEFTAAGQVKFLPDFPAADQQALFKAASEVWTERARTVGREAPAYRERVVRALTEIRGKQP